MRHGLGALLLSKPSSDEKIETLARAILGSEDSQLLMLARRVAEAELTLRRVTHACDNILRHGCDIRTVKTVSEQSSGGLSGCSEARVEPTSDLLLNYKPKFYDASTLERYQARAFSRRRFAIRAFDVALASLRMAE
jgi:hypothetical protein